MNVTHNVNVTVRSIEIGKSVPHMCLVTCYECGCVHININNGFFDN